LAVIPRLEVGLTDQHGENGRLRAGFGVVRTAEPFAKAAVGARPHADTQWVAVSLGHVSGGLWERLVTQSRGGLGEQGMAEGLLLRRVGVGARTGPFERVAARLDVALQIACRPTDPTQILEPVVVRFELLVSHAPVLNSHVRRQEARAVALGQVCSETEIGGEKSPGLTVPVHAAAAYSVGGHERTPRTDRQGSLGGFVAEGERRLV